MSLTEKKQKLIKQFDEAIANEREKVKEIRGNMIYGNNLEPYESYCNAMTEQSAEEHEQLASWLEELRVIKEMDLSIPQHFTKEQSDWIKSYCIRKNLEFYNKAIDDFAKRLKAKCRKCYVDCDPYGSGIEEDSILYEDDIDEIAEELKIE